MAGVSPTAGARQATGENPTAGARQTTGGNPTAGARQPTGGNPTAGARQAAGVKQTPGAHKPAEHQPLEQTSEDAASLAENWKQIKESASQIAGIIGGQISEGMSRLGSNLNDGVSHLSESAKPRIQGLTQRLAGFFTRKKADQPETPEEEPEETPQENKTPGRVIDPNRRRFYNPPPRE